jgi:hypothetical protein
MSDPNAQFAQLQNVFAPQQQMQLQTAANLKALTQQYNAQNAGLRGINTLAGLYPDAPKLQFGSTGDSLTEGLASGLGNGVNNFLAVKGYQRQNQMAQDLASQYQQQQQAARDLAQRQEQDTIAQEQNQYRTLEGVDPRLAQAYAYSDREGRKKLWGDMAATRITPLTGTAEGEKQVNQGQVINNAVAKLPPIELGGIPQPSAIDNVAQIRGKAPTLSLDLNKKELDNQQADVSLQKDKNSLVAQPEQLKQQIIGVQLDNNNKMVTAKYADAKAKADLLLAQGKVDEANRLTASLDDGMTLYNDYVARYNKLTPGQIKLFNSKMKAIKAPFELPEKAEPKYQAISKDGKVTQLFDPVTGQVVKPPKAQ